MAKNKVAVEETNDIADGDPPVPKELSPSAALNIPKGQGSQAVDALIKVVSEVTQIKKELREQKEQMETDVAAIKTSVSALEAKIDHAGHSVHHHARGRSDHSSHHTSEAGAEATMDAQGRLLSGREVYCLHDSVWDSTLFLGYIDGVLESVDMLLLGILNLVVQAFFCALLHHLKLAQPGIDVFTDPLSDFMQWRIGVAHQAEYHDPLTNSSLAQRVCEEYGGTIESRRHQAAWETNKQYIEYDPDKDKDIFTSQLEGPGLLMLALALWLALILKEIINIGGFIRMLLAATLNGSGRTEIKMDNDGQLELVSMSWARTILMFILVVIPRTAIALLLGYIGIFYLRGTFSVEEIILNAMALGFILEIDELLFSFLPAAARYAVTNTAPIPIAIQIDMHIPKGDFDDHGTSVKARRMCAAALERTRVLLAILVAVVVAFRLTLIADIEASMKVAQIILCRGRIDFVFQQDPVTDVVYVADTKDYDDNLNLDPAILGNIFDAVLQATNLCDELKPDDDLMQQLGLCDGDGDELWCQPCEVLRAQATSFPRYKEHDLDATLEKVGQSSNEAKEYMECQDLYTSENQTEVREPFQALLHKIDTSITVKLCDKMEKYCLDERHNVSQIVRTFCPDTCSCGHSIPSDRGWDQDVWFYDRAGCLPVCAENIQADQLEYESALLIGLEECYEHDVAYNISMFDTFIAEVEEQLVTLGSMVKGDDGLNYVSSTVATRFAFFTEIDFESFTKDFIHNTNSISLEGCTISTSVPINLHTWAYAAENICHWMQVVAYVFSINLCAMPEVDDSGLNTLRSVCPVECKVGTCSDVDSARTDFSTTGTEWTAFVAWDSDYLFGVTCDRKNYLCMQADKYAADDGWRQASLQVADAGGNGTTYYTGVMPSGSYWQRDIFCIPRTTSTSSSTTSLNSSSSDTASCYNIAVSQPDGPDGLAGTGARWRLTDLSTDQILITAGFPRSYQVCGDDWISQLGANCKPDDTVAVMSSWTQMQATYELVTTGWKSDSGGAPSYGWSLQLAEPGMFSKKKAVIKGGYDGTNVHVTYADRRFDAEGTIPLGTLGHPVDSIGTVAQDFLGCIPNSALVETVEHDPLLCDGHLTCLELASKTSCEASVNLFKSEYQKVCAQGTDFDDMPESTKLKVICPKACEAQEACDVPPVLHANYQYYSFLDLPCLELDCACVWPNTAAFLCWEEFGMTDDPNTEVPDYLQQIYPGPGYEYIPGLAAELTRVGSSTSFCASEAEGFSPRSPSYEGSWCYVSDECRDASFEVDGHPRVKTDRGSTQCSWRPASASECAYDVLGNLPYPLPTYQDKSGGSGTTTPDPHDIGGGSGGGIPSFP